MSSVVFSEKGKKLLVIEGYKFSFQKNLTGNKKRWTCASRKTLCKAYVKTEGVEVVIIESMLEHNHDRIPEECLNRQTLSNSVKRAAVDDICERPMKLIRRELQKSDPETLTTADIQRVRKNLHYARCKQLPKLPKTREEFQELLKLQEIKTNKSENFIVKNDGISNIVIFSCESNLQFLCGLSDLYVDGTFNYCPKYYLQLFTIHGQRNGNYIPLVFCLLPNKSVSSYAQTFMYVKDECKKLNFTLSPKVITADFETAIHKSIAEVFPETKIKGCRFHLGQSWYRKIQELGLSSEYNKNREEESEKTRFLTYIFGLPFLHPENVGDCFALDLSELKPDCHIITKFCDYLVDNYIDENSKFPPHIWAEHSSSLLRTTNGCESFHSKYNASFYTPHPNINQFLNVLLNFQIDTYVKMRSCNKAKQVYDSRVLKRKTFLEKKIKEKQIAGLRDIDFVKAISYHFRVSKIK